MLSEEQLPKHSCRLLPAMHSIPKPVNTDNQTIEEKSKSGFSPSKEGASTLNPHGLQETHTHSGRSLLSLKAHIIYVYMLQRAFILGNHTSSLSFRNEPKTRTESTFPTDQGSK